jgi:hypothetical protein
MGSLWRARKLALALAVAAGCGRQSNDAGSDRAEAIAPTPVADSERPARSGPSVDAETSESRVKPVALALDDRTIIGQPLTTEPKQRWYKAVRALANQQPSLVRVVTTRAEADWLLQVAALERTDVVYLAPAQAEGALPDDESLRMSPPGEAAIAWVKEELQHIARDGQSSVAAMSASSEMAPDGEATSDRLSSDASANVLTEAVGEADPQSALSPLDPDSDPRVAEMERARAELERARQRYEQQRFEAAGAKAGAILFHHGPAEDLKATIVEEQSAIYHTANRTQAVLGTYGKMVEGNRLLHRLARFEHRGIVQQLDRVRRFITVDRQGRATGKDFISLVGTRQAWQIVDLMAEISAGRHQEIAFEIVGMRLDQNDVIKALNTDSDALEYFSYLREQNETPCLVLENVVFASYAAASEGNLALGGKAKTILTSDGLAGRTENQRSSLTRFAASVIRCYQPYEVKLHGRHVVELAYLDP